MENPVYTFKLGAIDCLVIAEAVNTNIEERIRSVFVDDPQPILRALRELTQPQSFCRNILALRMGNERVLIDAGEGKLNPNEPSTLLADLAAQGLPASSITTIIITHFDGDHIGGLLDAGKPAFANARLIVPAAEFAYWMSDDTLASINAERADLLRRTFAAYDDRLQIADNSAELLPGVHYVPAYGHKPGQCAVLIKSEGERLLHVADAIHTVAQLNEPQSVPKFDLQPEVAIQTRLDLLDRVEQENLKMLAYHFTFPGVGLIRREGEQRVWIPND